MREGKINSRLYNSFRYSFGEHVDSLLADIEEPRMAHRMNHDSVENSNPLNLG